MEIKNILISTQNILEETNKLIHEKNKKYYNDVLDFMNLLFEDNAKNLSKIKFKKITLGETVFQLYNEIIKTYKLNKPQFDIERFNLEEIEDPEDPEELKKIFCEIAFKISNNLLERINYRLKKKHSREDNKTKFILECMI
jgi:hypothetical protein